jgi:hypothetical protein
MLVVCNAMTKIEEHSALKQLTVSRLMALQHLQLTAITASNDRSLRLRVATSWCWGPCESCYIDRPSHTLLQKITVPRNCNYINIAINAEGAMMEAHTTKPAVLPCNVCLLAYCLLASCLLLARSLCTCLLLARTSSTELND